MIGEREEPTPIGLLESCELDRACGSSSEVPTAPQSRSSACDGSAKARSSRRSGARDRPAASSFVELLPATRSTQLNICRRAAALAGGLSRDRVRLRDALGRARRSSKSRTTARACPRQSSIASCREFRSCTDAPSLHARSWSAAKPTTRPHRRCHRSVSLQLAGARVRSRGCLLSSWTASRTMHVALFDMF